MKFLLFIIFAIGIAKCNGRSYQNQVYFQVMNSRLPDKDQGCNEKVRKIFEQVENKLRIAGLNARPQIIETENGPELVIIPDDEVLLERQGPIAKQKSYGRRMSKMQRSI